MQRQLTSLEHHLDVCGLVTNENISLREQMEELLAIVRENFVSKEEPEVNGVLDSIDATLSATEVKDDATKMTLEADAFSEVSSVYMK